MNGRTGWLMAGLMVAVSGARAQAGDDVAAALFTLVPTMTTVEPAWGGGAPFDAEAWTVQSYLSGIVGDEDHGTMFAAHLGLGYFFADSVSINLDFFGGVVENGDVSGDDDGIVGGFDLLFRWHAIRRERWSFYLEGGCGFQLADTDFPSDSHHNFRPQLGIGLTCRLTARTHLMAGVRYLHVSNAHTSNNNDGLDGAMLYAGAMWGF